MTPSLDTIRTELGAAMSGAETGLSAANHLCTACVELLELDGAAISMIHGATSHGTFGSSSDVSRRLDEYQFTFGEGPCLDSVAAVEAVLVPDLDSPREQRWPFFRGAVLGEGIRAVFALPIMITSTCVGALDLYRAGPGSLSDDQLAAGRLVAELATLPLLDLVASATSPQTTSGVQGDDGWKSLHDLDRVEVYQATGMLISQLDVDAAEALVRLRAHAVATGQTASQVAWAIIERKLVLDRDSDHGGKERR